MLKNAGQDGVNSKARIFEDFLKIDSKIYKFSLTDKTHLLDSAG